jgi:acid phosphatase (class A)
VSSLALAKDKLDEPLYINESLFDLDRTIPPPPNPGTMEYKHEIEFMKAKIAKLNDSQKALAISDATNETVGFFSDTISNFDINKLPKTKALFEKVKYNAGYESKLFKNHFMSKRPYQADNDIHACVAPKPSNLDRSYPSGHTTMGYAMGIVLAELIPQKSKEIMERTRLYGENRINCGAHFPADVAGGQVLGTLVAKELISNKEFKLLMNEARDELVEAGLAQ